MSLTRDERISRYLLNIGNNLDSARIAYELLLEELTEEEQHAVEPPEDVGLIGHDDPEFCQHPRYIPVLDQRLCTDCGTNLDA